MVRLLAYKAKSPGTWQSEAGFCLGSDPNRLDACAAIAGVSGTLTDYQYIFGGSVWLRMRL
jgi:hypothetical protein